MKKFFYSCIVLSLCAVSIAGERDIKLIAPDSVLEKLKDVEIKVMLEEEIIPPTPDPPAAGELPPPDADGNILIAKSGNYTLTQDVTNTVWIAAQDVHLNLNGHAIRTNGHSIRLYVSWADGERFGAQQAPKNFHLIGPGRVESANGNAVSGRRGYDAVLKDATLVCHAHDTGCAIFGSGGFTASGLVCISNIPSVANRHALPSVIKSSGACTVENCAVIGGQVGIFAATGSTIRGNFISQNSVATNGYAVATHKGNQILIEDNLIIANNGRGVLLNHGTNIRVEGNVIFAREKPNSEYGSILNPCGIRVRYSANNNTIINNNCLAISMPGYTAGSGLYLTNKPGVSNTFRDNTFAAVMATEYLVGARYAKAVTLETQGDFDTSVSPGRPLFNNDFIENNTFASNHICLSLSGRDGYKNGAHMDNPLKNNKFVRKSGQEIINDFVQVARDKFTFEDETVKARFETVIDSIVNLDNLFDPAKGWDIWTEERWRTPVTITVEGSGVALRIRRSQYSREYPITIRILP